jgi:CBS domain-containing protein
MVVREAMSSPVVTIKENQTVVEIAKAMSKYRIGAIIVNTTDDQPIGIITERDLVYRVIAKDFFPRDMKARDVMSSPLRMVEAEMALEDVMRMMERLNIRRLGVTYKGNLVGIISDKDVLRIMPALIEIVKERSRIQSGDLSLGPSLVGYCDRCDLYSSNLRNVQGEFICEDCRAEAE